MEIVVEYLTKQFGNRKAIDALSFRVGKGESVGFWGPGGAGKSTAMKTLAGILSPDHGRVFFNGHAVNGHARRWKHHIGYLAEHNPMYEKMNMIDFLLLVGRFYRATRRQLLERVPALVQLCGLEDEKHKNIEKLSRGCRQRLGIAQALVHDPEVLILDEPAAGLDPRQVSRIGEIIRAIAREKTVLLCSRLFPGLEAICERIVVMDKGRIVADKSMKELRDAPDMDVRLRVGIEGGDPLQIRETLEALPGVCQVNASGPCLELRCARGSDVKPAIFDTCQDRRWYITELTPVQIRPEDLFHHLTRS